MTTLQMTHQRIDDIPLLIAIILEMGIPQQIDSHIKPHGHWQGISVGTLVTIWLCYILTEHDHRLVSVREWADSRQELFNRLLGIKLRETDLTDDRLANALTMLGDEKVERELDEEMVKGWITMYELPTAIIRHDSTSVSVYQEVEEEKELIGYGHSKDHRPDLPQFKIMLATLDPLGLPLTCQVINGSRADDKLYLPSYERAVATLGHRQVMAVGDSKMGALATRAYLSKQGSYYLTTYREPAANPDEINEWIQTALQNKSQWQSLKKVDERSGKETTVADIYAWQREQSYTPTGADEPWVWMERVLVTHSKAFQQGLCRKREETRQRVYDQLSALGQLPKRGRKRFRTQEELTKITTRLLSQYKMDGLINVTFTAEAHRDGGKCWRVADYQCEPQAWQKMVDHLGWQIYLSNAPVELYNDFDLVGSYRQQIGLERGISRLKSRNLNIRPIFLHDEQRITALTWLLCLALRVIVLLEFRVRRELAQQEKKLVGLNPASKSQATDRPTTERLLKAFGNITFSIVQQGDMVYYHVTPLTPLQEQILALLHLPVDIYLRLAEPHPKPLFNLSES